MSEAVIMIVALAALCCMATNLVLVAAFLRKKDEKPQAEERTAEEIEQERKYLERLQKTQKGFEDAMAYTGFPVRKGGNE